jgi:hypothetical protein
MTLAVLLKLAGYAAELVESVRHTIRHGELLKPDGTPYTEAEFDAVIAEGREMARTGIDRAKAELGLP